MIYNSVVPFRKSSCFFNALSQHPQISCSHPIYIWMAKINIFFLFVAYSRTKARGRLFKRPLLNN